MAFRLFIGGLPNYCTHDDLANWIFGVTGQWPSTRQLVTRGSGCTLQSGFVGFNTLGSMQLALNGLQASPWYANCKTTIAVSRDSKGKGKGAATGPGPGLVDMGVEAKPAMKDASASTGAGPVLVDTGVDAKPSMVDAETQWSFVDASESLQQATAVCREQEAPTCEVSPTEPAHSPTISRNSRSRSPTSPPPTVLVDPNVAKEEAELADTSRKIQAVKGELDELRKQEKQEHPKDDDLQLAEPVV